MAGRTWLVLGLIALLVGKPPARAADPAVERLRRDLTFLASDECEGRGVTTKGIHRAAAYIAAEFEKAGLKPAGTEGYFQPFTMPAVKLDATPKLLLRGPQGQAIELQPGVDFQPMGIAQSGSITAPLVFAGYGVTVAGKDGYDDYEGLDVEGKIVVVIRDTPRADNKFAAFANRQRTAALVAKLNNADKHKALAVLFVNDREAATPDDLLMDFNYNATSRMPVNLPALHLRRAVLDAMLQAVAGTSLVSVEQDIDRELQPRSLALSGWKASLEVKVSRSPLPVKNVVGFLEGAGPLAKETIVLGAHYDHLGYGGGGQSLSPSKRPTIHYGADDNGSGTTVLLELARRFGSRKDYQGRRLLFIAFSGEESGLLGSRHYCEKQPLFPLADTAAMLNMDMVGRLRPDPKTGIDRLAIHGTATGTGFEKLIDGLKQRPDLKLQKIASPSLAGGFGSSDHESFYRKRVPVLFFFTGNHAEYHRPTDTVATINFEGMRRIADLVTDLAERLAVAPQRPEFVKVATAGGSPGMKPGSIRIGIRPDYADDQDGVLLDGVTEQTPAEKAGLKAGDRIVEWDGKPVKNVQAYMTFLGTGKRGEPIELGVVRDGKKVAVKVVPE